MLRGNTQMRCHDNDDELTGDIDSTSNRSCGRNDRYSSFDVSCLPWMCLLLTKLYADPCREHDGPRCIHCLGPTCHRRDFDLRDNVSGKNYDLHANCSVVRAIFFHIQFSRLQLKYDFVQAVALFNTSRHDEAMQRVQDLTMTYQHPDTFLSNTVDMCAMVNLVGFLTFGRGARQIYLHVQLGIVVSEGGLYSEAVDRLDDNVSSITDLVFSRITLLGLGLMIMISSHGSMLLRN
jgi:hypothetical protein